MPYFPMFVDLKGKSCVVFGGGAVASRKVQKLLSFEALVTVVSPELSKTLVQYWKQGKITVHQRSYADGDMADAFLVIAATHDRGVNAHIAKEASQRGKLANIADDPKAGSMQFGAMLRKGDLVIGLSTSGHYPLLAKMLKEKIEAVLTDDITQELPALAEFRQGVIHGCAQAGQKKQKLKNHLASLFGEEQKAYEEKNSGGKS